MGRWGGLGGSVGRWMGGAERGSVDGSVGGSVGGCGREGGRACECVCTLFMRGLRLLSWRQVKHRLGYDDALDAFGVHGVGGLVGGVLTGCLCVCVRVCVSMCVCLYVRACARACVRRPVDGVLTGRRRRPAGPGRARIPEVLPADLPSCCFYAGWSSAP